MSDLNIKSSTIEMGMQLVKDMLSKVMGPAAGEIGELFGDNVKLWRLKNQIRIFEKIKKMADEKKLEPKQINLKILLPYLEGASLEEDDTLQDMWANLFVNYIDSNKNLSSNVHPKILAQLSTHEVEIMKFMYPDRKNIISSTWKKANIEHTREELANLKRLGLIEEVGNFSLYGGPDDKRVEQTYPEEFFISDFGEVFMAACTGIERPKTYNNSPLF